MRAVYPLPVKSHGAVKRCGNTSWSDSKRLESHQRQEVTAAA